MLSRDNESSQPRAHKEKGKFGHFWHQLKGDSQKLVKDLEKSLHGKSLQTSSHSSHLTEAMHGRNLLPERSNFYSDPSTHEPISPPNMQHPWGLQRVQTQNTSAQQQQQPFSAPPSGFQYNYYYQHPQQAPLLPPQRQHSQPSDPSGCFQLKDSSDSRGSKAAPSLYSPMSNKIRRPEENAESLTSPPPWVAPPDQGYRTAKLREGLAADYGLPPQVVQEALDFAETDKFADLYCFTYCLIGEDMKDAFAQATLHSFNKCYLLESFGDAQKGVADKLLSIERQNVKEAVIAKWQEEQQTVLENTEILEEDEVDKLREDIEGLSVEEALRLLGVSGPGFGIRDVQRDLFPGNGISTRTREENAKRSAAYTVAMEVLEK